MRYLMNEPDNFLSLLLILAVIGVLAIFYVWRRRMRRLRDVGRASSPYEAARPSGSAALSQATVIRAHVSAWWDFARVIIILAAIATALGLLLAALPQSAVETLAGQIKASRGFAGQEKIALLYLGDEFHDGNYRIRGVIRNITAEPLSQIDAVLRLYNRERTLQEAIIARLDKDTLEPGALARLDLTVPAHTERFAGFAVEFKLRTGDILPYQDLRAVAAGQVAGPAQP